MKMGRHSWLMMMGCAVPLVGIILLPLLGVKLGGVLPLLLILACPLSMIFMMGSMGKGHDHSEHGGYRSGEDHESQFDEETSPRTAAAARALPAPPEKQ